LKYQNSASFLKHLKDAFPDHLSLLYLIAISEEAERKKIVREIISLKKKKDPACEVIMLDGNILTGEKLREEAMMAPLWSQSRILVIDSIDKMKKSVQEVLISSFTHRLRGFSFLLGASSLKGLTDVLEKEKKELVVLDLSAEKPWDRQTRLKEWIVELAKNEKKTFGTSALSALFDRIGYQYASLEQEMNKLISYVGDKNLIEVKDVEAICCNLTSSSLWQFAEAMAWETETVKEPPFEDVSSLLSFIPILRSQLQIGLKIKSLLSSGSSASDLHIHFPGIRPHSLEKFLKEAQHKPAHYFIEGIKALFSFEWNLKSSSHCFELSWELFKAKIAELKGLS
jgi:DNA polymerase-3 subunit delta